MKVGFFSLESWQKEYLQNLEEFKKLDIEPFFIDNVLDKKHLYKDENLDGISIFIGSVIDRELLDKMPNLKFVDTRSTGYDHIDLEACKERGIIVSYSPAYGERTVAEFAFALILTLTRKVYEGFDRIKETGRFSVENLRGIDLMDKTLGVIGAGRIGRNMIHIAKGFSMDILAYDIHPDNNFAKEAEFKYVDIKTLLASSDIITLHVPYMESTHHLINKKTIYDIKKGAFLINTSRGAIIETEALIKALKDEHLGGAGLDVLEEEGGIRDELEFLLEGHPREANLKTMLANHILIDMPNVIITPHNAFNTWGALKRILKTSVANIDGVINNNPINLVPK